MGVVYGMFNLEVGRVMRVWVLQVVSSIWLMVCDVEVGCGCGMRDSGCGMRDSGCGMRDSGCGCVMRDSGCGCVG